MSASVRLIRDDNGPLLELGLVEPERELLQSLTAQLIELLSAEAAEGDDGDGDPAVARLLPDGYRGDEEAAAEFRQYTRAGLIDLKTAAAAAIGRAVEADGQVRLTPAEAERWLPALTDLRLVLAERLGIHGEGDEAGGPVADVYDWLGTLQAGLVAQLDLIDSLRHRPTGEDG